MNNKGGLLGGMSKGHKSFGCRVLAERPVLTYSLSLLLVVTTNTLPGMVGGRSTILTMLFLAECIAVLSLVWANTRLDRDVLGRWIIWVVVLATVYMLICVNVGELSRFGASMVCLFAVVPITLAALQRASLLDVYLRAFVNTMAIVALVSLVLWFVGPVFGLIEMNCAIINKWGGNGLTWYTNGYFNLQYVPQWQNLPMGIGLFRNTSFFAEAPMYSYALCCALLIELFCTKARRMWITLLLSATVITTFSSTGVIFLLGVILIEALRKVRTKKGSTRTFLMLLFAVLFLVGSWLAFTVFDGKMQTSSGSTRLDDFAAGFKAWSRSPWFGYGFTNTDVVKSYMSAFRADNLGFSNSLFQTLVMGGVLWLTPYIIGLFGYLKSSRAMKSAGILLLFLWVVTVVSNIPLTVFMFGLGVSKVIAPDSEHHRTGEAN